MKRKRKYDYIFFDDMPKERILHWFKFDNEYRINEFLLITKNNTYWYCERCDEDDRFSEYRFKPNYWIRKSSYLYRLKESRHQLNLRRDRDLWEPIENFNRFEIMIREKNDEVK